MKGRIVIIGNSGAGLSALRAIRSVERESDAVIISEEDCMAYSPVCTSHMLEKEIPDTALYLTDENFYREMKVSPMLGKRVVEVDVKKGEVRLEDGAKVGYDKLLIASGSRPRRLSLEGFTPENTRSLRTVEDARRIASELKGVRHIIFVGAGLISMQVVSAIDKAYGDKIRMTIVELMDRILPAYLDKAASDLVAASLKERGHRLHLGAAPTALEASKKGKEKSVKLEDGTTLKGDMVFVGVGIQPNTDFLKGTPVSVDRGVVVNAHMRTSVENVYAAGDVCQWEDFVTRRSVPSPLWPLAVEQGAVAGFNMAGKDVVHRGNLNMNVTELFGSTLASVGVIDEMADEGITSVSRVDERSKTYRKVLFKGDRLVGSVGVNNCGDFGTIYQLIAQGAELAPDYTIEKETMASAPLPYARLMLPRGWR